MYHDSREIGNAIKKVGWAIIIVGVIGSLLAGAMIPTVAIDRYYDAEETYNWALALAGSAVSVIDGVLVLGLAEIIFLLDDIKRGITKSCDKIINEFKGQEEKK